MPHKKHDTQELRLDRNILGVFHSSLLFFECRSYVTHEPKMFTGADHIALYNKK